MRRKMNIIELVHDVLAFCVSLFVLEVHRRNHLLFQLVVSLDWYGLV